MSAPIQPCFFSVESEMVQAKEGILIRCDAALKQLLLFLDRTMHFIVQDLDSSHVMIRKDALEAVRRKVGAILDENAFSLASGDVE